MFDIIKERIHQGYRTLNYPFKMPKAPARRRR